MFASLLANSARRRAMTSEARFASRIVRRAVSTAPSTLGGTALSITHTCAGVGHDAGQRLIDFMRYRRRQSAERRDPGYACELGSRVGQGLLGLAALRYVLSRPDVLESTLFIVRCMRAHVQVFDRMVGHLQALLVLKVAAAARALLTTSLNKARSSGCTRLRIKSNVTRTLRGSSKMR
jgi:hypothetical protein